MRMLPGLVIVLAVGIFAPSLKAQDCVTGSFQVCDEHPVAQDAFHVPDTRLLADADLALHPQQCDALGNHPCETSVDDVSIHVTPEPVTMLLLGSGLAGVGAAARRRRRRQPTEVEVDD